MGKRIGINLAIVGAKHNSFSYYAENIIRRFIKNNENEYVIVGGKHLRGTVIEQLNIDNLPFATGAGEGISSQLMRYLWQWKGMRYYEEKHKIDMWYTPTHHGRISTGVPQIITIHDLIPLRFPDQNPIQTFYFRNILPKVIHKSRMIIAVSESTKRDIVKFYNVSSEKIEVIYLGHDTKRKSEFSQGVKDRNLILVPGAGFPHKNAIRVIQAYSMLEEQLKENYRLVITGAGNQQKELERFAFECGIQEYCTIHSYLKQEDMESVWNRTALLVYVSLWEGFGIPPLEAMSRGIPCVVSNIASLPEVCGDAAVYVDPYNPCAISEAIESVIGKSILNHTLVNKGYERVKFFSWDQACESVYRFLNHVY